MNAQQLPVLPQLVVTLTVDQLRTDYLENFSALYGNHGFKRLPERKRRFFRQATYPFDGVDRASAIASLFMEALPR